MVRPVKNYVQGYEKAKCVTILIGVAWGGKPIAGVINQPFYKKQHDKFLGRTIWGIVGLGSFIVSKLVFNWVNLILWGFFNIDIKTHLI